MPPAPERRARLSVKVVPRGQRSEIVGWIGGRLKIRIAAVPEGGRANEALVAFVAERLGLPRRCVRVVTGHTATSKILEIDGIEQAEIPGRLGAPSA